MRFPHCFIDGETEAQKETACPVGAIQKGSVVQYAQDPGGQGAASVGVPLSGTVVFVSVPWDQCPRVNPSPDSETLWPQANQSTSLPLSCFF